MSDEESFVILGSSPTSSLENDVMTRRNSASSQCDAPSSQFESLKSSQIQNSRKFSNRTQNMNTFVSMKSQGTSNQLPGKTDTVEIGINGPQSVDKMEANCKLWNTQPQVHVEKNMLPLSLDDCALQFPLEQKRSVENYQQKSKSTSQEISSNKATPPLSIENNLAAGFLMGEVNSDVLKTSVYSQFPSISMEACAEDVLKLQTMVTEYSQLKSTIKKANNTMKLFYQHSIQWKEKMKTLEEQYKMQLDNCQKEIDELRKQNKDMETNFKMQIEALEIVRNKDREENIREISEKNALLENMRAQIIKLEQRLTSFEFVGDKQGNMENNELNKVHVTHREHELKIKDLQKKLSVLLASNLDLKDIEKQYIEELNCLKVNLIAAEELIAKNRAEIVELTSSNIEKQEQIKTIENSQESLKLAFEEQKQRILILEAQNEVHRADFEMEKQGRETAVKEKQQILHDLRTLQKRNQELIEEHQKLADNFQKRLSSASAINESQITAASAAAQTYSNNPQRPIRALPTASTSAVVPPVLGPHMCPICNKAFRSLNILLSHVNDCVDKN